MIKKYNFENNGNKAIIAEILTQRERLPRATFLSSLAVVMVAATSLTMVFGSLSTAAVPLEQTEQPYVSSVTDGDALPPEVITRVHTETQTKTIAVYSDSAQNPEPLLLPEACNTENPGKGKAIFDQKKHLFQWQYKDEKFTFFVKNNTVYRRSEKTGKTIIVFKGDSNVSLYCVTDRYLFFRANNGAVDGRNTYCYRVDLITKEILRLFNYMPSGLTNSYRDYKVEFVRIDGSDVIFTHYIVHEDGSYEEIPDKPEKDDTDNPYSERTFFDSIDLYLNEDNTISAEDCDGNICNLGVSVDYIESLGYKTDFGSYYKGWIYGNKNGEKYIEVPFYPAQYGMNATLSYYGRITDNGLEGGLIKEEISDLPDMSYNTDFLFTNLYVFYDYDDKSFSIPLDFGKLTAAAKSEPEYYSSEDGEVSIIITYYPCKVTAATPDSAGE